MKINRYLLIAVIINIALYVIVFFIPYNILRVAISYLVSWFVFVFGIGLKVAISKDLVVLSTGTGEMEIYQTFYEILTIIALTIPLYLSNWKELLKKLGIIIGIMLGYYILLYGMTIVLLQNGFNVPWLISFIKYNTEAFMIFAFGVVWWIVNKKEIMKLINEIRI